MNMISRRFLAGITAAVMGVALATAAQQTVMPRTAAAAPGDMTLTGTITYDNDDLAGGYLYVYSQGEAMPCLKATLRRRDRSFTITIPASTTQPRCGVEGRNIILVYESDEPLKSNTSTSPKITFSGGTTAKVNVMVTVAAPAPYTIMRVDAKVIRYGVQAGEAITLRAYTNGKDCGATITSPAPLVTVYIASAGNMAGCGKDGDPITFTVNGKPATAMPPVSFRSGGFVNTTLTVAP